MNNETCRIDWSFIESNEGSSKQGYVPCDSKGNVLGVSGCTVACGVDLGQQTAAGILAYQFSSDLYKKLLPYTEKRGETAKQFVLKYPLYLSGDEVAEINSKVHARFQKTVADEYNAHSDFKFEFLDSRKQTAIADLAFQYGSLKTKCPKFFALITAGLWAKAVYELKNFGDSYETRRLKEATLLQSSL